jgi:hypothetical protein
MVHGWSADGPPNGPSFGAGRSTSSKLDGPRLPVLIPLHLPIHNPHMHYMSSLFYLRFAMLNHASLYHLHIIKIIYGIFICQASLHLCLISFAYHWNHSWHIYLSNIIRAETVMPKQEEGEPKIVGDDTPIENQGRHLYIFYYLFWINEVYMSCLCMSYYIYKWLLRTYLIHYQPYLGYYFIAKYFC